MRLKINEIRKEDCQNKEAAEERRQVRTFLVDLPWRETENEEQGGIAWVELYIPYRLHGRNLDSEGDNFLIEKSL